MSFARESAPTLSPAINRAFSKQSRYFDQFDGNNEILQDMRQQVYYHVSKHLSPESHILELNAGTGIDALHFASMGHRVHATDLSDGMINQIASKGLKSKFGERITYQQVSNEQLNKVTVKNFDYAFSNFGGLNCTQDLSKVTRQLSDLLKPGAFVTWVIMPPVCLSELLWVFKGQWKKAFRRLNKQGTRSHLEGEYFLTFYHSLKKIRSAFGPAYKLIQSEGLAALSPQPHLSNFAIKSPWLYKFLRKLDGVFRNSYPFNRWADHIIVTFQYRPRK